MRRICMTICGCFLLFPSPPPRNLHEKVISVYGHPPGIIGYNWQYLQICVLESSLEADFLQTSLKRNAQTFLFLSCHLFFRWGHEEMGCHICGFFFDSCCLQDCAQVLHWIWPAVEFHFFQLPIGLFCGRGLLE